MIRSSKRSFLSRSLLVGAVMVATFAAPAFADDRDATGFSGEATAVDVLVEPGNPPRYPLCDVAQYLTSFSQPGEEGTVYIYGHAREGMLLRLLQESLQKNGAALLGARVEVDTSDGQTYVYLIDLVKRHARDFSIAEELAQGEEQVVLQTSEGPTGTVPKLQIGARLVETSPTPADRPPPKPKPRVCA